MSRRGHTEAYLDPSVTQPLAFDTPLGEVLAPRRPTQDSCLELLALLLSQLLHLVLRCVVALGHLGERLPKAAIALGCEVTQQAGNALKQGIGGAFGLNTLSLKEPREESVLLLESEDLGIGGVVCESFRVLERFPFR